MSSLIKLRPRRPTRPHHPADFEVVRRQAERINAAVNDELAGFKGQVGRILDAGDVGRKSADAVAGQ